MKASKSTEAQIAFVLKQAEDGTPIGEVCRKAGISDATFYNWRKKYAWLMPYEMKRLRQLEEENAKLKRIVADLSLDKAMCRTWWQKALKPSFRPCDAWPVGQRPAGANWWTRCAAIGRSRRAAHARR